MKSLWFIRHIKVVMIRALVEVFVTTSNESHIKRMQSDQTSRCAPGLAADAGR